jgi:hypothetical protein
LVIAVLALTGCETTSSIPKQPDAPTSASVVSNLTATQDKVDGKVAAAVTVAKENANAPRIVESELGVALSLLDKPSDSEVALARQRAEHASPADYEAARKFGHTLLASLDAAQAKMDADQKEAARISQLKDAKISALNADIVRIRQEASRDIWTMTGAGLVVLGGLACAFASVRMGLPLLICGAFAGSVPFIVGSVYFSWIAGATLVSVAGIGVWHLYDITRSPPPPPTDEQAPKV